MAQTSKGTLTTKPTVEKGKHYVKPSVNASCYIFTGQKPSFSVSHPDSLPFNVLALRIMFQHGFWKENEQSHWMDYGDCFLPIEQES